MPFMPVELLIPMPGTVVDRFRHVAITDFADHSLSVYVKKKVKGEALSPQALCDLKGDFDASEINLRAVVRNTATAGGPKVSRSVLSGKSEGTRADDGDPCIKSIVRHEFLKVDIAALPRHSGTACKKKKCFAPQSPEPSDQILGTEPRRDVFANLVRADGLGGKSATKRRTTQLHGVSPGTNEAHVV